MVPSQDIRDLRDLTRYRRKLTQATTAEKNRIHKILQDANIKLTTFMSDLFGVSGRLLLEKLIHGEVLDEPEVRALVKSKLKKKVPQLLDALNGKLRLHHREMIDMHWQHIAYLEKQVEQVEAKIDAHLQEYKKEIGWLDSIPGIDQHTAAAIFAEIGPEVSTQFPTDAQLASWVGICPGNNESAGKKKSTKCPQGNKHVKASLCQAAWANERAPNRIGQFFRQIRKRRGEKKGSVAAAHMILRIIYALMRDQTDYKELDVETDKVKEKSLNYFMKQIQSLGFNIQVTSQEAI
jgi:transposase